jgi:hypothetical protein
MPLSLVSVTWRDDHTQGEQRLKDRRDRRMNDGTSCFNRKIWVVPGGCGSRSLYHRARRVEFSLSAEVRSTDSLR